MSYQPEIRSQGVKRKFSESSSSSSEKIDVAGPIADLARLTEDSEQQENISLNVEEDPKLFQSQNVANRRIVEEGNNQNNLDVKNPIIRKLIQEWKDLGDKSKNDTKLSSGYTTKLRWANSASKELVGHLSRENYAIDVYRLYPEDQCDSISKLAVDPNIFYRNNDFGLTKKVNRDGIVKWVDKFKRKKWDKTDKLQKEAEKETVQRRTQRCIDLMKDEEVTHRVGSNKLVGFNTNVGTSFEKESTNRYDIATSVGSSAIAVPSGGGNSEYVQREFQDSIFDVNSMIHLNFVPPDIRNEPQDMWSQVVNQDYVTEECHPQDIVKAFADKSWNLIMMKNPDAQDNYEMIQGEAEKEEYPVYQADAKEEGFESQCSAIVEEATKVNSDLLYDEIIPDKTCDTQEMEHLIKMRFDTQIGSQKDIMSIGRSNERPIIRETESLWMENETYYGSGSNEKNNFTGAKKSDHISNSGIHVDEIGEKSAEFSQDRNILSMDEVVTTISIGMTNKTLLFSVVDLFRAIQAEYETKTGPKPKDSIHHMKDCIKRTIMSKLSENKAHTFELVPLSKRSYYDCYKRNIPSSSCHPPREALSENEDVTHGREISNTLSDESHDTSSTFLFSIEEVTKKIIINYVLEKKMFGFTIIPYTQAEYTQLIINGSDSPGSVKEADQIGGSYVANKSESITGGVLPETFGETGTSCTIVDAPYTPDNFKDMPSIIRGEKMNTRDEESEKSLTHQGKNDTKNSTEIAKESKLEARVTFSQGYDSKKGDRIDNDNNLIILEGAQDNERIPKAKSTKNIEKFKLITALERDFIHIFQVTEVNKEQSKIETVKRKTIIPQREKSASIKDPSSEIEDTLSINTTDALFDILQKKLKEKKGHPEINPGQQSTAEYEIRMASPTQESSNDSLQPKCLSHCSVDENVFTEEYLTGDMQYSLSPLAEIYIEVLKEPFEFLYDGLIYKKNYTDMCNMLINYNARKYVCKICLDSNYTMKEIRKHLATHARIPNCTCLMCNCLCRVCGVSCATEREMLLHLQRLHYKVNQLRCQICNKQMGSNGTLREHYEIHITSMECECFEMFCKYKTNDITMYRKHLQSKHKYVKDSRCKFCKVQFEIGDNLLSHYESKVHKENEYLYKSILSLREEHKKQILDVVKNNIFSLEFYDKMRNDLCGILKYKFNQAIRNN